jgi:hypothetical protein
LTTTAILENHYKKVPTLMLTFLLFKKEYLLYGRVGAGAARAGAASNFLHGAGAA